MAKVYGSILQSGHRPKEFLNWPENEQALAASMAMALEQWRLEQIGKMLGG